MQNQKLLEDLFSAYFCARSNKRFTKNALSFEVNLEENIISIFSEIVERKYTPRPSICFGVTSPVSREIFAADFSDRIVHHLIYGYISPIFEKNFINDCYSCRIGRGVHYGIKRAEGFMRSCSQNYQKDCYILKLDIKSYFMSMKKDILFKMVEKVLYSEKSVDFDMDVVLYLLEKTIFERPEENCVKYGEVDVPFGKSLFDTSPDCGLPIGNLTSQLFGNVYLNDFDHFVKKDLGFKYYGRYVDDFVLVHEDKEYLKYALGEIRKYLKNEVGLVLHPEKIYLQHFSKGFKFLGVYIKPFRKYILNRTKGNFFECLGRRGVNYENSVNSYLGLMGHCKTFKLRKKYLEKYCVDYSFKKNFLVITRQINGKVYNGEKRFKNPQ